MKKNDFILFTRPLTSTYFNSTQSNYINKLNKFLPPENIYHWHKNQIAKMFTQTHEELYVHHIFNAFCKWLICNQTYELKFIHDCDYLIDELHLQNKLNTNELNYLNKIRSVNFAKIRNIKKLMIDFPLNDNEDIWYIYSALSILRKQSSNEEIISKTCSILLTNKRILFTNGTRLILELKYKDIDFCKLSNIGVLVCTNNCKFDVVSDERQEIYVSLERIGKIIKRHL